MPTHSITRPARITTRLLTLGGLLVIFLGCSTMSDYLSWVPFTDNATHRGSISSAEVDGFFQQVKPVRGDAESVYRLALHFQKQGRHEWAIDEFRRVLAIEPGHARAYNGIGVSHDHLGRYHQAAEAYGRALALDPSFHEAWNNLGYSALLGDDVAAAVHSFRRAIALEGRNPRYHNNLGLAYARLGQEAQAYAEFRLAGGETEARRYMAKFFPPPPHPDGAGAPVMAASASHPSKVTGMTSSSENTLPSVAASMPPTLATLRSSIGSIPAAPGLAAPSASLVTSQVNPPTKEGAASGEGHRAIAFEERNGRTEEPADEVVTTPVPSPIEVVMVREADGFRIQVTPPEALSSVEPEAGGPRPLIPIPITSSPEAVPTAAPPEFAARVAAATSISNPLEGFSNSPAPYPAAPTTPPGSMNNPKPSVLVSNGNGVRRMAAQVGNYLGRQGFEVSGARNAEHFSHMETMIYYCEEFLQEAYQLAQTIPGYQNMEKVAGFNQPDTAIHLVLGRDVIAHRWRFAIDS